MTNVLYIVIIIVGILIIGLTLLQGKDSGIGSAWGGSGAYQTRRGIETWALWATVVLVVVFFIVSIINLVS